MVRWSHHDVRALLRELRRPHNLERHALGVALARATGKPSAREALLDVTRYALANHDRLLLDVVYRCDFSGARTKLVADELHVSPRQLFRYRAVAIDAIASEIERTLLAFKPRANRTHGGLSTVVRRWHGRVPLSKSDAYMSLMRDVAIAEYRSTSGNLAAYALRREDGPVAHFEMLSMWECEEAIRRYAGDRILVAKYYDFDRSYLLEFEEFVTHYHAFAF